MFSLKHFIVSINKNFPRTTIFVFCKTNFSSYETKHYLTKISLFGENIFLNGYKIVFYLEFFIAFNSMKFEILMDRYFFSQSSGWHDFQLQLVLCYFVLGTIVEFVFALDIQKVQVLFC